MRPILTHLALQVRELDRTISFYRKYAGLQVAHDRVDGGTRVAWLGRRETDNDFVLVLIEVAGGARPWLLRWTWGEITRWVTRSMITLAAPVLSQLTTLRHLGFAVASREEVDAVAAAGRADGVLVLEPTYAGPIVGYFCILEDPDGNRVEFSYGQPINTNDLTNDLPRDLPKNSPAEPSARGGAKPAP